MSEAVSMAEWKEKLKLKLIPSIGYLLHQIIDRSLDLEVYGQEYVKEIEKKGKPIVFAAWHNHFWLPSFYLRNKGYGALSSRSRDGEYSARILDKLGWDVVRGSTSKGSVRSLLKLIKKLRQGQNIGVIPDGPTGPRHKVKRGVLYLAQKTESVIIPLGVSFAKKKVFNSWDRFELPYPFSKAVLVHGEPFEVTEVNEKVQTELNEHLAKTEAQADQYLED